MSVDTRGEHVEEVWVSRSDIDALVYAIEHALECQSFKPMGEMTRRRLSYLSGMLLAET